MKPKEKAKELFDLMFYKIEDATLGEFNDDCDTDAIRAVAAKQCALITLDEMLELLNQGFGVNVSIKILYWQEVKQEIEKL